MPRIANLSVPARASHPKPQFVAPRKSANPGMELIDPESSLLTGVRHAIDKQAEELVFEAACALDSAIGSPRQRRCTCLQTGGLPLLFPRLVDASG